MMTVLTRSALHWMEAHRRRAETRRLREQDGRSVADLGLRPGDVGKATDAFEGALDAAYRDSARLRATYALH